VLVAAFSNSVFCEQLFLRQSCDTTPVTIAGQAYIFSFPFLGAFRKTVKSEKLRHVCPHGTTLLLLDVFS